MPIKRITILGSTGSIGRNALAIVSRHRNRFRVVALTAGQNIDLLKKQIHAFSPEIVAVADKQAAHALEKKICRRKSAPLRILFGEEGISAAAEYKKSDFVLSAIVGAAGLVPGLAAIRAGKTVGLANKEALVMAGRIMIQQAKKYGATLLPVDSEHSAIFQCIEGHKKSDVRRIILTASGGPFSGKKTRELRAITPAQALNHPSWKMGRKITIDSATLMNKGLEVIEAHYLFGLPAEKIDVIVHPQSIVHSLVEFHDRSCIAQMSVPDMKAPIAYALTYPNRLTDVIRKLSLHQIGALTFKKPEMKCFPCLAYAYRALREGGTMPSVLNASNEVAVHAFLKGVIRFTDIPLLIKKTMDRHTVQSDKTLPLVLEADRWARETAKELVQKL
ncbi:MAG: 1-deoxy-D-xylulose-5-phosphate reductoisomerase [Thermodesulfovibrionales bacterium]|nr:1-deoxy-D-xylulose-5-phosphate reductoisomerase [Thermodesulfovibrionales bacterium]